MGVLILGASGLIGSAVAARLVADHHEVVAATRSRSSFGLTPMRTVVLDLAFATNPGDWLPHLEGIDAVVAPVWCRTVRAIRPSGSLVRRQT